MKRLINKKASYDTPNDFLMEWCTHPNSIKYGSPESIEKMVNENPDCVVSVPAYRFIELFGLEVEGLSNEELISLAKTKINAIEKYDSFSSSKRGVEYFITQDYREFGVIIQASVRGLDIKALASKYKDEVNRIVDEYTNTEDEIVPLDDVGSYEIVAIVIEDQVSWL